MFKWGIIICFIVSMLSGIAIAVELGQEQLGKEYVVAVNAKDLTRLKQLVHPDCLACINNENSDFYDNYFAIEMNEPIPDNLVAIDVTPIDKGTLLMEDAFSYPVRPTHWMQVNINRGPLDSKSILRQIVKLEDKWLIVVPCPTLQTVERFRKTKIKKEKQKERARILLQELQDPLLSELKKLLKQGRLIRAWQKYNAKTGESMAMTKEVLSLIKVE